MDNTSRIDLASEVIAQPRVLRGQRVHTLYDTLVTELQRRGAPELVTLFAEPVEGSAADHLDWYGPSSNSPALPWSELSNEQQQQAARKLSESISRLKSLADGSDKNFDDLLAAIQLIPSQDDILIQDGSPLLVRWGMVSDSPHLNNAAIIDDLLSESQIDASEQPGTIALPEQGAKERNILFMQLLSVALTLLFLSISSVLALRNCGLALPRFLTNGELVYIMNFCPDRDALYDPEAEYIGRLEQDLARELAQCPVPELPDRVVTEEEIIDRVNNQGVEAGQLAITLAWNSTADLDLHVLCPTGEHISHKEKRQCQGTLQLDMNHGANRSVTPIESIFWPADNIPSGQYQVHVACFEPTDMCSTGVPYTVDVKDQNGHSVATFDGVASKKARSEMSDGDPTLAGMFEQP